MINVALLFELVTFVLLAAIITDTKINKTNKNNRFNLFVKLLCIVSINLIVITNHSIDTDKNIPELVFISTFIILVYEFLILGSIKIFFYYSKYYTVVIILSTFVLYSVFYYSLIKYLTLCLT